MELKISLLGMASFGANNIKKADLFSGMIFDFDTTGELRENVINKLCLDTQEYPCIYNDFSQMQTAIKVVTDTYRASFKRWFDALQLKYNAIENYDRTEETFDTRDYESKSESSAGSKNDVTAYDASDYVPESRAEEQGKTSNTANDKYSRMSHVHGNIGVTSSQDMLMQEIKVGYFNLVQNIVEVYKNELVIRVI